MKLKIVILPDNIVLVDTDKKIWSSLRERWYTSVSKPTTAKLLNSNINNIKPENYPILYQTQRILEGIPLVRESDLREKDRYTLEGASPVSIVDLQAKITERYIISFPERKRKDAQDYCNFLNRKEQQVDVEELAKQKAISKYSEEANPLMNIKSRLAQRLGFYSGFIAGFNASKGGGWNDEDMIGFAKKCIETGLWEDSLSKFKESARQPKYKPYIEVPETPSFDEEGYLIVK